jgi:mitogen-activated protein kinase kinase
MSIIELMHQIVQEPSPRLPEDLFPTGAEDLVDAMLLKSPEDRKTPKELLVRTLLAALVRITHSRLP